MNIIKDVTIINETRLRLGVDAKAGDEIDLTLLNKVNTSIILEKINNAKDELYNRKLLENEKLIRIENENKILSVTKALNEEITKLRSEVDNVAKQTEARIMLEHEKELNTVKNLAIQDKVKLEDLNAKYEKDIATAVKEKEHELNFKIKEMENLINVKTIEIENIRNSTEKEKQLAIKDTESTLNKQIKDLEFDVNNLRLQRSYLNVKKQGENLEGWCDSEYSSYSVNGFETCVWFKDNKSVREDDEVKGTKADYRFGSDNKDLSDPLHNLLISKNFSKLCKYKIDGIDDQKHRIYFKILLVLDYISGMTDYHAIEIYNIVR